MSRKSVWIATLVAAIVVTLGSAAAQYRGGGYGYGYYPDPYGGEPNYYYPDNRPMPPQSPYGRGPDNQGPDTQSPYNQGPYSQAPYSQAPYGDAPPGATVQGPPEPAYVDPYNGGRDTSGGGYDLGANANRTTKTEVANATHQPPGVIVIDTTSRHLYFTEPNGQALQYGIGVGREGFAWHGVARVQRKAEWPEWIPPSDMMKRRPDLPERMEGGIDNPLGARALYLYQGKRDTLFRIHGTNEPDTIGQAVSSGCIRMMNADVIDLYSRVPVGTKVVVL